MARTHQLDPVDALYRATTTPSIVRVPDLGFLCIDGHGDPNTSAAYAEAVQALYGVSYAAKFASKKAGGPEYKVSALEGLWWAEDMSSFGTGDKSDWDWTMMIRQPDAVEADLIQRPAEEVAAKKALPAARGLRLERFEEGAAAQVLHVGPYATEAPTIRRLHEFIHEHGVTFDGHVPKTPRDLPERPAPYGTGEAPHDHPAAIPRRGCVRPNPPGRRSRPVRRCRRPDRSGKQSP